MTKMMIIIILSLQAANYDNDNCALSYDLPYAFIVVVVVAQNINYVMHPLREIPLALHSMQLQEQRYPLLLVCAVFSCVRTKVWLL